VSWNSNHQNRAIQVLSDAEAEDMQLQKEQHAALWQDLQLSLEGKKDLDSRQLHELGDWQARESAKWNGVASKLNAAIANNRGRADVSTATAAAQEATAKANQAHQNAIQAKATAMHMDAQTAYTKEETKTQDSVRAKNYADAANARAMAANGGVSKFDQQLILRIPTILQRDPDLKVLTSDKGPLKQLSDIQSLQQDLREASASGDAGRMAAAIAGAREQINRLNTGASPTKQTSELIDALQSEPSKIQANLSRLIGDPSNGKQFVDNLYHMLDNGREEKLHQIDDIRGRVDARHKNPKNPIRKSKAAADELDAIIDSNFQGVKNGGGTPRYPEGGSSPNQVTPQAAPAAAPAKPQPGAKARVGGNPVTYNGSLWIDDKTGKPVPGQ
jgi:hypothetical protein